VIAGCVTICNTSRNTRAGEGWWSAQVDAVDHAACCIWSAMRPIRATQATPILLTKSSNRLRNIHYGNSFEDLAK
jgi:hypothetical protein